METDRRISFLVGRGNWTKVAWQGGSAYVRFETEADRKTWRIAEVRFDDATPEAIRSFPFSRVEIAANAHSLVAIGLAMGGSSLAEGAADVPSMLEGLEPVPLDRLRL